MTAFGDAFAAARKAGKSTFTFNGKKYTTKTKEESQKKTAPTPATRSKKTAPTPRPRSERPSSKKAPTPAKRTGKPSKTASDRARANGAKKNAERAAVKRINSGPGSKSRSERLSKRNGYQTGGGF